MLGISILLLLVFVTVVVRARREAGQSPYQLVRLQARKRMQSYTLLSAVTVAALAATVIYSWEVPEDDQENSAIITYAKQGTEDEQVAESVAADQSPDSVAVAMAPSGEGPVADPATALIPIQANDLPGEFSQIEATAQLKNETNLSSVNFSTDIAENFTPQEPANRFEAGRFRLYATFAYEGMSDGMSWSWVWRHNGEVVGGGNQLWSYGSKGPGYIYFSPQTGFTSGEYTLDFWINGRRMAQSQLIVTDNLAAGN